ncbi:carbon storage regulator [Vibrio sp. UCD-FRSSP16_10]|uniref:carbon storage regulator n=1 Tax=unclassified Vibrio TaxID=2614977 RepID=UPI0007FD2BAF|nr:MULTISPECIES: carbon storage regulator [unclassified Vibrio]OBT16011.1 carbon storage regulator [Vibrio sp. UCD-FRSSP16_30]OBT21093.1 carbon storage regulator [Vibrio sp. UCD-FRSSP16_10]
MRSALYTLSLILTFYVQAEEIALPSSAVSIDIMEQSRGKKHVEMDFTSLASDIDGAIDGNVADNTVSGSNIMASGAFSDNSGISSVIQNTGNNVLIQNSTIVNLSIK